MGGKGASSSFRAAGRLLAAYGSGEGERSNVGCVYDDDAEERLLS